MITYEFNRLGISDWHKPPEPVHYDVSSVVLSVIDETKSMAPITSGLSAYVNG